MSEKKASCSAPGVACDVSHCKYNTVDCHCTAAKISVQNNKAVTKGETFCSTFCPRGTC